MMVDVVVVVAEIIRMGRIPFVWAKAALFQNPFVDIFLSKIGGIRVFRPPRAHQDKDSDKSLEEIQAANTAMFEHTYKVLLAGDIMILYPEGTSYTDSKMLPLKTGALRAAVGFAQKYQRSIAIVPAGLNYLQKDSFRSEVVLEFGSPMIVEYNASDSSIMERERVVELTAALEVRPFFDWRKVNRELTLLLETYACLDGQCP